EVARRALLAEGVAASAIAVTGNTVIDALQWILSRTQDPFADGALPSGDGRPFLLVTAHRRENFERLHRQYFTELDGIAAELAHMQILFVRHPNTKVQALAAECLTQPNIFKVAPLAYGAFLHLMRRAALVITDSGGIQE